MLAPLEPLELPPVLTEPAPPAVPVNPLEPVVVELDPPDVESLPLSVERLSSPAEEQPVLAVARQRNPYVQIELRMINLQRRELANQRSSSFDVCVYRSKSVQGSAYGWRR
jgi:hypothetical protein